MEAEKSYIVQVSCQFDAESPEDAVRQMVGQLMNELKEMDQ